MDTTELLKKVRKIEIKTKGLSNHIFSGEYHSAFKGRGMSFSELFRDLLAEREKRKDIMAFAGSICDFDIDRHTLEGAKRSSKTWEKVF